MDMEQIHEQISLEVADLTKKALSDLHEIWKSSFNEETIKRYTKKLTSHVAELYSDILDEAVSTKDSYIAELEGLMVKVSEACKALSEPLPQDSFKDLPLHDANEVLKKKIEDYNVILNERRTEVMSLKDKEEDLCDDLGLTCKGLPMSPLPSERELDMFRIYLAKLEEERFAREEELLELREDLARIFDELEIKPSLNSEIVMLSDNKIKVTEANMKHIRLTHLEYQEKLEHSKSTVLELREKLSHLWERLEEDPIIRNEFLRKHKGHGNATAFALREEILKCEERKRNNIKVFIEKMRREMRILWKKCMLSEKEIEKYVAFHSDYYTEDLLTLHEMHVEELELFYSENERIFELLNNVSELWEKIAQLESNAHDPTRYNNRGGKLLLEEKERKKICAKLPKVEQELLILSEEYTKRTQKAFTVYGRTIEEVIRNKHLEHKIDKQCQLSARKHARAVTPLASSTRTGVFSATKTCTNLFGTPVLTTKRKRSPLNTPRNMNLKSSENVDPLRGSATKPKKNLMSIKKTGSVAKRRSGQRRSNSKIQKVLESAAPEELINASKNYADFKTHLSKNAHLRSSIAPNKRAVNTKQQQQQQQQPTTSMGRPRTPRALTKVPVITLSGPTPPNPPTRAATPRRLARQNTFSGSAGSKTPRLTRSSSVMSPGSISNRLTTKNLPIII